MVLFRNFLKYHYTLFDQMEENIIFIAFTGIHTFLIIFVWYFLTFDILFLFLYISK